MGPGQTKEKYATDGVEGGTKKGGSDERSSYDCDSGERDRHVLFLKYRGGEMGESAASVRNQVGRTLSPRMLCQGTGEEDVLQLVDI